MKAMFKLIWCPLSFLWTWFYDISVGARKQPTYGRRRTILRFHHGSWASTLGGQAWKQVPVPTESSRLPFSASFNGFHVHRCQQRRAQSSSSRASETACPRDPTGQEPWEHSGCWTSCLHGMRLGVWPGCWVYSQHIGYPQVFLSLSSWVLLAYINHTECWAYNSIFIYSYSAPHLPVSPPTPVNPFLFQSPPSTFYLLPFVYVFLFFSFFLSTALPQQLSTESSGRHGPRAPLPLWRNSGGASLEEVLCSRGKRV